MVRKVGPNIPTGAPFPPPRSFHLIWDEHLLGRWHSLPPFHPTPPGPPLSHNGARGQNGPLPHPHPTTSSPPPLPPGPPALRLRVGIPLPAPQYPPPPRFFPMRFAPARISPPHPRREWGGGQRGLVRGRAFSLGENGPEPYLCPWRLSSVIIPLRINARHSRHAPGGFGAVAPPPGPTSPHTPHTPPCWSENMITTCPGHTICLVFHTNTGAPPPPPPRDASLGVGRGPNWRLIHNMRLEVGRVWGGRVEWKKASYPPMKAGSHIIGIGFLPHHPPPHTPPPPSGKTLNAPSDGGQGPLAAGPRTWGGICQPRGQWSKYQLGRKGGCDCAACPNNKTPGRGLVPTAQSCGDGPIF